MGVYHALLRMLRTTPKLAVDAFVQEVIPQHAILMPWVIATELPSAKRTVGLGLKVSI